MNKKIKIAVLSMFLMLGITTVNAEEKICDKVSIKTEGKYTLGDKYSCDPGDGTKRNFYVLEEGTDTISLIMDRNLVEVGGGIEWSSDGTNANGPTTVLEFLTKETAKWTDVKVSLPTYDQIHVINDSTIFTSMKWLYENLDSHIIPNGYWTGTASSFDNDGAWTVNHSGNLFILDVDSNSHSGVRPVITISKNRTNLQDKSQVEVKNPETSDNILKYTIVGLVVLSSLGLISMKKYSN